MTGSQPALLVFGAGRMGTRVSALAAGVGFEVLGVVSRERGDAGQKPPRITSLQSLTQLPSVVIDFSLPGGAVEIAAWCAEQRIPLVTGTTGLDEQQQAAIVQAARTVSVLQGANFSPGFNLLLSMASLYEGSALGGSRVSLKETHHVHKRDIPSGSALALANAAGVSQERIESVREGEVVGDHSIQFDFPGERLCLHHSVADRDVFARGALEAAHWLLEQSPGLYAPGDWVLGMQK